MIKSQQHIEESARAQAQFQHGLDTMAAAYAPPQPIVVAPTF
jgi:hypothetical protein